MERNSGLGYRLLGFLAVDVHADSHQLLCNEVHNVTALDRPAQRIMSPNVIGRVVGTDGSLFRAWMWIPEDKCTFRSRRIA